MQNVCKSSAQHSMVPARRRKQSQEEFLCYYRKCTWEYGTARLRQVPGKCGVEGKYKKFIEFDNNCLPNKLPLPFDHYRLTVQQNQSGCIELLNLKVSCLRNISKHFVFQMIKKEVMTIHIILVGTYVHLCDEEIHLSDFMTV